MNAIILPVLIQFVGAIAALFLRGNLAAQRFVGGAAAHGGLGIAAALAWRLSDGSVASLPAGGWPAAYGIVLSVDLLGAIMLCLSGLAQVATWWYVAAGGIAEDDERRHFHPVFLLLTTGVAWAFVTGDLFNLFVSFELILLASYVLLLNGADGVTLREGVKFVVLNVIAGTLFLAGVGFVYGAYGTLNMAEIAIKVATTEQPGIAALLGTVLLVVFGIKAGLFPLFFWLPDAYPKGQPAILPYFSGILTKVGVYCLYRTFTLIWHRDFDEWFQPLLLAIGGATMIVGVLGALSRNTMRHILSFHIISQIGYMIFGLAMGTAAGLAGGIFYIVHHILAKSALFMIAACTIHHEGTDRLDRLEGLLAKRPLIAGMFLFSAFSLAGLPPLSGFYGKYLLIVEGIREGHLFYVLLSIITSLLTMASMVKIWQYAFMGGDAKAERAPLESPAVAVATMFLVSMAAFVVLFSAPLMRLSETAAATLLAPERYIESVRGPAGAQAFLDAVVKELPK